MLRAITLKDFRSFRDARLPLAPLTTLVGANASGKSNLVEGIRLLSMVGRGSLRDHVSRDIRKGTSGVRGTLHDLGRDKRPSFGLGCETRGTWSELRMTFSVDTDNALSVTHEEIRNKEKSDVLYSAYTKEIDENTHKLEAKLTSDTCEKHQYFATDGTPVFALLPGVELYEEFHEYQTTSQVCEKFDKCLNNIIISDVNPEKMRKYCDAYEILLDENASNVSSFLYNRFKETGYKTSVLNFVRSLPEQNIQDITFIETPRDEVMLALTETFGGEERTYDATLLSDGTLRVLAIAAALLSAPEGTLIVVEEIDNGVHPTRAEHILNRIKEIAEARDLRVLISTHNPALLDALPDDAVPDTVFCYRNPADGASELVRLEDIPEYPALMAQGRLGHLVTRGLVDRYAKDTRDAEARTADKLKALEDLFS